MEWSVNLYKYLNGYKEYIGTMSFGEDYKAAKAHYVKNKDKELKAGRLLEVKVHEAKKDWSKVD